MISKYFNRIFAWFRQTVVWQNLDSLAKGIYLYMRLRDENTRKLIDDEFKFGFWKYYHWCVKGVLYVIVLPKSFFEFLNFVVINTAQDAHVTTLSFLREKGLLSDDDVPDINYMYTHIANSPFSSEYDVPISTSWETLTLIWMIWLFLRLFPPYCYWLALRTLFYRTLAFYSLKNISHDNFK